LCTHTHTYTYISLLLSLSLKVKANEKHMKPDATKKLQCCYLFTSCGWHTHTHFQSESNEKFYTRLLKKIAIYSVNTGYYFNCGRKEGIKIGLLCETKNRWLPTVVDQALKLIFGWMTCNL